MGPNLRRQALRRKSRKASDLGRAPSRRPQRRERQIPVALGEAPAIGGPHQGVVMVAGRGQAEVEEILLRAVAGKPTGHRLDEGLSTRSRAMFQIGG